MTPASTRSGPGTEPQTRPPGWSSNPSEWPERLLTAGLALSGFAVATYLALYQIGVFHSVWEPFFGSGSERVLHSWISKLLPIPDASLGASGYLVEVLSILWGGTVRWKAQPWAVLVMGLTAALMAAASVVLMVLQPVAFGAWCTLCLVSAAISLAIVGPAMRETLACFQQIQRSRHSGVSLGNAILGRASSAPS